MCVFLCVSVTPFPYRSHPFLMESSYESFLSPVVAPCLESHLPNGLCLLPCVLAWLAKVNRMGYSPQSFIELKKGQEQDMDPLNCWWYQWPCPFYIIRSSHSHSNFFRHMGDRNGVCDTVCHTKRI